MHFSSQARKNKKILPEKTFLIFQETEILKNLLIFREMDFPVHPEKISYTPKKTSYVFSKESCSYISRNGNPKKLLILQKTELPKPENQKFLYFSL